MKTMKDDLLENGSHQTKSKPPFLLLGKKGEKWVEGMKGIQRKT
jgi:hypothetical protein